MMIAAMNHISILAAGATNPSTLIPAPSIDDFEKSYSGRAPPDPIYKGYIKGLGGKIRSLVEKCAFSSRVSDAPR